MLTESYFVSVSGPPLANNTSIPKDAGVYEHMLHPTHATSAILKKSSVPCGGLALGDTHVFAAQQDKSTVHVYARPKGNQEAAVHFPERIRSITISNDVLFLGTQEGRIIVWEFCTGRQVTTPPCHVQAVTCMAITPYHLLTGSDDSNVHVWSLSRLLELDQTIEHEPQDTLSNHRAAITSLVVSQSVNPDTNICVTASEDKSCVVWNYQLGTPLRTVLFPSTPISLVLDPCARAFYASTEDRSLYAIELFGEAATFDLQSDERGNAAVQVSAAFGAAPHEAGPATCLGLNYDGTILLSGHPQGQVRRWDLSSRADSTELASLNAAITNITFVSPLSSPKHTRPIAVVKPFLGNRSYNITSQIDSDLVGETRFSKMVASNGIPQEILDQVILAFQEPAGNSAGNAELQKENEELWEIINEQRALQRKTLERKALAAYSRVFS
ncbi:putative wd repeat-containing protein [Rosellinia necatrix]|uniref:Pre-rRNA-processing protein IPI3 n=1 Tax=Rosellinia necatrix TaxID=77044 RepID=A0A1W2TGB1_ROSNE|nr:putative wd repeat-containing protein [Rosellinia necatrix]